KLDPEFPEAYAVGTYIYADGCKNNKAAIKYVCEGIKNNPKSWDLDRVAAIIYARRMNDPQSAIPYAKMAISNCDDKWYRVRMHWLLNSVERMAREKKLANQPRALPQQ
ncbi:hypothetical protein LLG39_13580, partial [bacterium]|nr:hypothetical protein [bacterium]